MDKYTHIAGSSSTFCKDLLPRLSAMQKCQAISNVIKIESPSVFHRPIYADSAITKISVKGKVFFSIRDTAFEEISTSEFKGAMEELSYSEKPLKTKVIKTTLSTDDKISLSEAKIVVSGGRAMKSKENFQLLQDLAKVLFITRYSGTPQ